MHDKFGQHRIKDFAWRITEELMEAYEAYILSDKEHTYEELADALHFMAELCLICGIPREGLDFELRAEWSESELDECMLSTVLQLGLACNCLKNKPWKQTQMLTDVEKFNFHIYVAFESLMSCFAAAGIEFEEDIYDLYFRKNKVNQFRQEYSRKKEIY